MTQPKARCQERDSAGQIHNLLTRVSHPAESQIPGGKFNDSPRADVKRGSASQILSLLTRASQCLCKRLRQ